MKETISGWRRFGALLLVASSLSGLASAEDVVFSPFDAPQFDELFPTPDVTLVGQDDEPTVSVDSATTCSTEEPLPGTGPAQRCSSGSTTDDNHEICSVDGADGSPDSCSTRNTNAGHCSAGPTNGQRSFCSATGGSPTDEEFVNCSTHIDGDNACSSQGEGTHCSASAGVNGEGICSAGSFGNPNGGTGGTAVCSAFTSGQGTGDPKGTCSAYAKGATCSVTAGMVNAGCSTFDPPPENGGAQSFAEACSSFGLASKNSCSVVAPPPDPSGGFATSNVGVKCSVHNPPVTEDPDEITCSTDASHDGDQEICTSAPWCETEPGDTGNGNEITGGGGVVVRNQASVAAATGISPGDPLPVDDELASERAATRIPLTIPRWLPRSLGPATH